MKRSFLASAAVGLAVLAGAAVAVVVLRGADTTTVGAVWTADAEQIYGRDFAQFRSPVGGSEYDSDDLGVVEVDGTIVTLIGLPNPRSYQLDSAILVGIDSATGDVRWKSPAEGLGGCAYEPVDGDIVCYSGLADIEPALITYDAATGDSDRYPTAFGDTAFGMTVSDGRVFLIEGNAEDNDVRVHAGSVADVDEGWARSFDVGDAWESVPPQPIQVSGELGIVPMGFGSVVFDVSDGRELWSGAYPECFTPPELRGDTALVTETDCDTGDTTAVRSVTRAGTTLIADSGSTVSQSRSGPDAPIVIGTTAYDSGGGTLFTSALLSQVVASTSETIVVQDSAGSTSQTVGLDARTGEEKWRSDNGGLYSGIIELDGSSALSVDGLSVEAIDLGSGDVVWTAPLETNSGTGAGVSSVWPVESGVVVNSGQTMTIVPRPVG
ncbi:hypothetical protein GCM10007304_34510 [Rhodococcoides trifolii]|uniref:Pyrrolo-quinoline quinone repeat domain-containing protein n=1 Tax=Rhodococcoides trifolii TaxID=908250 RepID=A0A917G129_9NOCA|nr:PQQ-binding-like beta-propeller repeat protein [Rhodococcus trifolii]GGG17505.1 hypothetical protein GCM10007304_34510 [Rhodococcus trifolii]